MDARKKWIFTCLAIGAIVVTLAVWTSGWTWWTLAIAALLLVCPAIIVWLAYGAVDAGDS